MRVLGLLLGVTVLTSTVPAALVAQTGAVRGRVTDQEGTAIYGAQVSVMGTQLNATTDAAGTFMLANVPAGSHRLRVRRLGYQTSEISVAVRAGTTVTQDFSLAPAAIILEEVTVGSRARHTAADELAVPVDIFPAREIERTAQVEMASVLQELSPSVNFPRPQIADITSGVRPFQLRGLSPDHSLVLINGKRRHPTAVVHVFGASAMTSGSSGVDMNAIPSAAIGQIEILRDGAAAQYGSDAIAGVINLKLRDDPHPPEFTVQAGRYVTSPFPDDGNRLDVNASWGLDFGQRGTLNLAGAYQNREPTDRAGPDPRDQMCQGDPDLTGDCDGDVVSDTNGDGINEIVDKRNPVGQPNHLDGDGEAEGGAGFYNLRYTLGGERNHQLYSFGGVSYREDVHSGFYRRATDPAGRNWIEIHPFGFLPKFRAQTRDVMVVTGVAGVVGRNWTYDLAGSWGQNNMHLDIFDSNNASLGPCLDTPCAPGRDGMLGTSDDPGIPNKTDMFAGILELNQLNATFDVTHQANIGAHSPLNIAVGAAFRADNYKITGGEPASWINGFHPSQTGGTAAPGSQVFVGYRPAGALGPSDPGQAVDDWRTNIGMYVDLETDVTDAFLIALAGRFESYSDFGERLTGKVAARFQPAQQFILRAAASTGFRAPSQSQKFYAHTSTGFTEDPDNPGNQIAFEIGEFPVGSPEARALGAEPLKEETSVNVSAGFALTPTESFTITVDGYRITVKDRIILTGEMSGPTVDALLADFAASTVKFFTNAVDTRTWGLDVTARYRASWGRNNQFEGIVSYNFNDMDVTNVDVPDVIDELRDQVFTETDQVALEKGRPRDRFRIGTEYSKGPFTVGATASYYGTVTALVDEVQNTLFEDGPHVLLDAKVGYELTPGLQLTFGVENLLDEYPELLPEDLNFLGIFLYSGQSGFGYNGRHVYTALRAALP